MSLRDWLLAVWIYEHFFDDDSNDKLRDDPSNDSSFNDDDCDDDF